MVVGVGVLVLVFLLVLGWLGVVVGAAVDTVETFGTPGIRVV